MPDTVIPRDHPAVPKGWKPGAEICVRYAQAPARGSRTYDAKNRTIEAVMATGYRVKRWYGWEELAITDSAVNLQRVALGQVHVIDHHNTYERNAVLGTVIEARIENGTLIGKFQFGDTEVGRAAEKDAASGDLTGVSVGYRVNRLVLAETSDEADDVYRAESWELLEASIVAVPADPHAGTRSAPNVPPKPPKETEMPNDNPAAPADTEITRVVPPPAPASPAAPAAALTEAEAVRAAERDRITEITALGKRGGIPDAEITAAIGEGWEVQRFRNRCLDALMERGAPTLPGANVSQPSGATLTRDEVDTRREAMTEALSARFARAAGDTKVTISEKARPYGEMGLVEMAAACIGYRGMLRTTRQVVDVWERAMMTTSDFPIILMDTMNRRLLSRYAVVAPTYRAVMGRYTNPDFRAQRVIRAGDFPELQEIPEHGEIKSGTFGESMEQFSVKSYGVMLNFSRQMLINDQLGAIDQVLGSSADRVGDWENKMAFATLLAQSAMGPDLLTDETPVFDADHKNVATSGTVIDVAALDEAMQAMVTQQTIDGMTTAAFTPRILLCGPKRIVQAQQILTSIVPHTVSETVPEMMKTWRPVMDPQITDYSFYLFADPGAAPCFLYGYLQGFEGPRMAAEQHFSQQGMRVKLEHDFGTAAIDYRGAFRNAGDDGK